jgi:hypothetical protein
MDGVSVKPASTPEGVRCVQIRATPAGKVNLADFQNAVPVARDQSVPNERGTDVEGLRLTASSEPAFLKLTTWHIDHLGAGQTVCISVLDLSHDGALRGRLTGGLNRARNIARGIE